MALFEFELDPVRTVTDPPEEPSWFLLSYGAFRVNVGDEVLFRYADGSDAAYPLASFARDILQSVAPGVAPLPPLIARIASDCDLLERLFARDDDEDLWYTAWRWLGERSPWMSYLIAHPEFHFLRLGDDVRIHWDNRDRVIDGAPAWAAQHGWVDLPVEVFLEECRDFVMRLLAAMNERVTTPSLREQHESWRKEFARYFEMREPDVPWEETEAALRELAAKRGITL